MTCVLCADYEEQGKLAERERIIKLLEDFIDNTKDLEGMAFYRMGVQDAIHNIKGENK